MPRPASPGCGLRSGHQIPFFLRSRLNLQQAHAAPEEWGMGGGSKMRSKITEKTDISHLTFASREENAISMPLDRLSAVE